MTNTAKKTAKTTTATKSAAKIVNVKAKTETPSFEKIIAPMLAGIEENQILIHDNAKLGASYWKGIGDHLIELQSAWIANGGDIAWRGKNRTKTPIDSANPESFPEFRERVTALNKHHASDAVKIAQNWSFAAQIDPEEISEGGVNKIRTKIDEVINGKKKSTKKQGPATGNTSKKSKKTSDKKTDTGIDLASLMTDPAAFGAMIGKLVNSKYTDVQKKEYINSQAQFIIIKSLADAI